MSCPRLCRIDPSRYKVRDVKRLLCRRALSTTSGGHFYEREVAKREKSWTWSFEHARGYRLAMRAWSQEDCVTSCVFVAAAKNHDPIWCEAFQARMQDGFCTKWQHVYKTCMQNNFLWPKLAILDSHGFFWEITLSSRGRGSISVEFQLETWHQS